MILIDIETQDFGVEAGIYEVACMVVRDYEVVDQLYLGIEIEDWEGERIYGYGFHNICDHQDSMNTFKSFIEKYELPLVAHNCPFDRKFLVYYNWITEDYPCYCSMRAIRNSLGDLGSYSLSNLVMHFNISDQVTHKAFDDVIHLLELLKIVKPETWFKVGQRTPSKTRNQVDVSLVSYDRTNRLQGEVICFTGTSQYTRIEMQAIAKANGANISDKVTNNTTMLVVGENAGSKLAKAQEKDIVVIPDKDFMEILNINHSEILFKRQDTSSDQTIISTTNKLSTKQKDIEMRKTKFLPQSVFDDRKKKWYKYEPEMWVNYAGEFDEHGVEWKPLNILERFADAEGYYISANYELKRPNGKLVPIQSSIKGKTFYPTHYAMLFMVEEYNRFIPKYRYINVEPLHNRFEVNEYHEIINFKYCSFILFKDYPRPQSLHEAIDQEVESRFEKKHGMKIIFYFTEESKQEALQQQQLEKLAIRKVLVEELRSKNILVE